MFETTRDSGFLTISENFGANELLFAVRLAGKQSENRAGNRKLTKLHELSLEIIRTKGLNEILTLTCKAAVEIFNVDHSGLVLFEKDLSKGKTIAEFPEQEKRSLGTVIQVKGIPAEENLVLRKEIINIFDLNPDKSLGKVRALLMDFGVRSILVVPVILSDNVIASFSLDMIRRNRQFFQDEIELCKHLGNHVAASIENARLIDELSVLNKIGQELSPTTTLTEDDILKMVYEQTSRLMDVTNFYVAFYYKDYDFVEFRFAIENEQRQKVGEGEFAHRRGGNGLTEYIVRNKGPVSIPKDVPKWLGDHRVDLIGRISKSWLGVPLISKEEVIGVIGIQNYDEENAYSEGDRNILCTIAAQAALAIQNARLFQEAQSRIRDLNKKNRELEILNAVGRSVSASGIESIAEVIYRQTSYLLDTNNFFLCIYDQEENQLDYVFWIYNEERIHRFTRKLSGLTGFVIKEKRPLLICDWDREEKAFPVEAEIVTGRQRSWLGVPMMIGEKVIGVISVQNREPNVFDKETQRLLETIASQAAVAIENSQLFEQIQQRRMRQIEAIRQMAASVSTTTEMEDRLRSILQLTLALMRKAQLGELWLLSEDSKWLDLKAWKGVDVVSEYPRIPVGTGIIGWVAEHGEWLMVNDVTKDARFLRVSKDTKSEFAVPLLRKGKVVGVMNIEHDSVNAFCGEDLALLEAIAGMTVVAIENAKLIEHLEDANKRIGIHQEMLTRMIMATDFAHRVKSLAGTIPLWTHTIKNQLSLNDATRSIIEKLTDKINVDVINMLNSCDELRSVPQPSEISCNILLEALIQRIMVYCAVNERLILEQEVDPHLFRVHAIYSNLDSALWGVMSNSIEAMSEGGRLTIHASNSLEDNRKWVKIITRDEGEGIAQEKIDLIFDLFYSTKGSGRGYGLWRSKVLVEEMGGRIYVESQPGNGSKFEIVIPAID